MPDPRAAIVVAYLEALRERVPLAANAGNLADALELQRKRRALLLVLKLVKEDSDA